ncbi:MAG: glycosyltransferase family 2 protein, partial [Streptosporangiaceae bacterium]
MSNRNALSLNESYPQHVVTAVIVAHDGVSWLPQVADAVLEQTRPVQRVVAVDTGSRDRSGAVLATKFGQSAVFGMDRGTGYGTAVARALTHRAANLPVPSAPGIAPADRVEWIWLLHDDCEPAPDALEQLLRGAAEASNAAVLGPKIRDWISRDIVLEAGVTLDSAARRVTGIEPREVDQGQHDGDRDAMAVSSAGMLIRRDVWDQLGGFDTGMSLFMDDIDFCWRVHSAGYRVRVITDAVVYHVRAATKHRRSISVGRRAQMLDRRNGLVALLGNLPFGRMLASTAGNLMVSLLRVIFFLLAKRLMAALDESAAVAAVLAHPLRMFTMRRRRAPGRRAAYSRLRGDLPSGHSPRRLVEFASSLLLKSGQVDTAGSHHASIDPDEDDSLLVDNGLARRILTSPRVLVFVVLLVIALAASHSLLGGGPLGGGSLVPTWGGASDLWRAYLQAFHPTGIGSTAAAPAYLPVVGALATLLLGKAWLAIDVILIGSVPLAGMTAMIAASRVTSSVAVRIWVAATYALLPVAMGVIAAGRFGTAVAFILLPLIALSLVRVFTASGRRAGRAAWAAGLLVAIGAAFVPLLWLLAVAGCLLGAIAVRAARAALLRNLAVVVLATPVLLFPWTTTLAIHPSHVLIEAGLPQPGAVAGVRLLLLLNPGGPGMPPYWVTGGLIAAAFAALFVGRRRKLVLAGWGVALSGMLAAILASHVVVRPGDGGAVVVWAGLPVAVAAIGLLVAAAVGADGLARMLAGRRGWRAIASGRGAWVVAIALLACSAPVLAAGFWVARGVTGPVHPVAGQVVPELVAVADGQRHQVRTLVLRSDHGQVSYLLMRGPSPTLADTALAVPATAQRALRDTVAALTSPTGGSAVNLSQQLANFDIGYVLVRAPVDPGLAGALNDVSGLRPYSTTGGYSLWQLDASPASVTVLESNGTVVPIPSGPVGLAGVPAPSSGGILMLSEPVSAGWHASLNGRALARVPSPAGSWAQAFRLPPGGGALAVGYTAFWHGLALAAELIVFLIALGLALPGIHVAESDAQPAGEGRSAGGRHGASRADDAAGAAQAESSGDERSESALSGAVRSGSARSGSARSGAARSGSAKAGRAATGSAVADTG